MGNVEELFKRKKEELEGKGEEEVDDAYKKKQENGTLTSVKGTENKSEMSEKVEREYGVDNKGNKKGNKRNERRK